MASTALQVIGFVLGVLSWIGMIGTCASPEWRKNSHGQTLIDNTLRYDGLWFRCKAFSTGQTHCDDYNEFFIGLPGVLQVCRALMVASIAIGFIAVVVTILGLKCTSVGYSNARAKARVAMVGGLLFGVAAVLAGSSVSYYAHGVAQEYYNPILEEDTPMYLRFEYGSALFVGWASLVVGILGGIILCFTSVFIIMRMNAAARRGKKSGEATWKSPHDHNASFGRQHHLPTSQPNRNINNRQVRMMDKSELTQQRVIMHNAAIKNGHSHAPDNFNRHGNLSASGSSSDKAKRYPSRHQHRPNSEHVDAALGHHHHRHHHHHHHIRNSKSENSISKTRTEHERRPGSEETDENNGFKRARPAKEYV